MISCLAFIPILLKKDRIYVGGQFEFGYFENNDNGILQYNSLSDQIKQDYNFSTVIDVFEVGNTIYFASYEYTFMYKNGELEVKDNSGYNVGVELPKRGLVLATQSDGLAILSPKD